MTEPEAYVDPELPEGEPPPVDLSAPCVPEVVALLERLLSEARRGEVVAAAIVTAHADLAFGTGYEGDHQPILLGGLAHLMHRLNRDLDAMEDE